LILAPAALNQLFDGANLGKLLRGVPLNHLVGRRFRVGAAVLFGGRLNFPCKYLEKLLGLLVYLPLYNRSGLNCWIEKGSVVRRGRPLNPLMIARPYAVSLNAHGAASNVSA
jgi:MOSC domain-containing protein YiiM